MFTERALAVAVAGQPTILLLLEVRAEMVASPVVAVAEERKAILLVALRQVAVTGVRAVAGKFGFTRSEL